MLKNIQRISTYFFKNYWLQSPWISVNPVLFSWQTLPLDGSTVLKMFFGTKKGTRRQWQYSCQGHVSGSALCPFRNSWEMGVLTITRISLKRWLHLYIKDLGLNSWEMGVLTITRIPLKGGKKQEMIAPVIKDLGLKGAWHKIFNFRYFYESVSPEPPRKSNWS